jgi:hypothetical protein
MFVMPHNLLFFDQVNNSNVGMKPRNREERRKAERMAKPSKGTKKDKRLKRNRKRRK